MRSFNRFLSAAVALAMLGSSFSGSVSAMGAENVGLDGTTTVTEGTTEAETAPDNETVSSEEPGPAENEETEDISADHAGEEEQPAGTQEDGTAPAGDENPYADGEDGTCDEEDADEEQAETGGSAAEEEEGDYTADEPVPEGNVYFVIEGEGYTISLRDGEPAQITAERGEEKTTITDAWGDKAVLSGGKVTLTDGTEKEVFAGEDDSLMICSDGRFAVQDDGITYAVEDGSLTKADEDLLFAPVVYRDEELTLTLSGEEGSWVPFSVSAAEGFSRGEWTVPSGAEINETGNGFTGSVMCSGTEMEDGNTCRFRFSKTKEDAAEAPLSDTKRQAAVKAARNKAGAAKNGEGITKNAADAIILPSEDYTVTFDANGGAFEGGGSENVVVYTTPDQYISKTDNVTPKGIKTGIYGSWLSTSDFVTIPGAEKLYITITYQTEGMFYDYVCIYDKDTVPTDNNSWNSISGRLGGTTMKTVAFEVEGDTVQFYFKSNGSRNNYLGYYAKVTSEGTGISSGQYEEPELYGSRFVSWNTAADGTGISVAPDKYDWNDDITLYAVYKNNKEAVWFEDGEMVIKNIADPIEPYIEEHGNVVRRAPFRPVNINITKSYDDVVYDPGYMWGSIKTCVRDSDGNYLTFDSDGNMSGITSEEYSFNARDGDIIRIPEGDYTVSFAEENKDFPDRHRIGDTDYIENSCSVRVFYTPELSVGSNGADFTMRSLNSRPDVYFFYVDEAGVGQPAKVRFPLKITENGVTTDHYYKYVRSEAPNGDVVFTYDPENGTEEWITLDPNKRTVIKDTPYGSSNIESSRPVSGWKVVYSKVFPNDTLAERGNAVSYVSGNDSYSMVNGLTYGSLDELYEAKIYHKYGVGKDTVNAKFCLTTYWQDSNAKKYVLDHYDTYEYYGNTFTNVYIPRKEVVPLDSDDSRTVIETDENGNFTVFYPGGSADGHNWSDITVGESVLRGSPDMWLCEIDSEKGYYPAYKYSSQQSAGANYDVTRYSEFYNKRTGEVYGPSFAPNPSQAKDINIEDIGIRICDFNPEYPSENRIKNLSCPRITKIVSEDYIPAETSFKFELYADRDAVFTKIAEVSVKNGETVILDPKDIEGLTNDDLKKGLWVRESAQAGWQDPQFTGECDYDSEKQAYKFRTGDIVPAVTCTNSRKTASVTLKKSVENGDGDYTHRFKITLWDEIDGDRYPFNGYTFNIGSESYSTNENGEVFVNIDTHLAEEAQAEFSVPERCRYRIEEVSSTLGTYSTVKTNDKGIVPEGGVTSTWVNSYKIPEVVISKTDVGGHEIAGAQLKVTGRETGASADITPITWTSEEGKDKTISVRPGTYTLHEEAVPEGGVYAAAADITFTVDAEGNVKAAGRDVDKVTMVDQYAFHEVVISKTDVGSHEIAGAQLKITGREEGAVENITPITWTSVEGQDKAVELRPGIYNLHEEAVPESGVFVQASDIGFVVTHDGKVKVGGVETDKVTMVDQYAFHDVVISKTDVGGHEIAGAQLKVTGRETGASADITPITWTSEEGKDKTISVRPGTYTLHEEAVPEGGVYVAAADITFTVDAEGNVKAAGRDVDKVTMVDQYAFHDVVISKTDVGGHEIAGAQLKVTGRETGASADITPITWTSEEGKDKTISVRPGTYTLHEEAVPEGGVYVKASDITFTVDINGRVKVNNEDVSKVTMVDEYNGASLKVKKTVSGNMGSRDKEFDFTITLKDDRNAAYTKTVAYKKGEETGTLTPNASGTVSFSLSHGDVIEFTDLMIGTRYEVAEADYSAEGYTTTSQNGSGTVAKTNPDAEFVNRKGSAVPTGIASSFPWVMGLAMLAGAAYVTAFMRRRKKN